MPPSQQLHRNGRQGLDMAQLMHRGEKHVISAHTDSWSISKVSDEGLKKRSKSRVTLGAMVNIYSSPSLCRLLDTGGKCHHQKQCCSGSPPPSNPHGPHHGRMA